MDVVKIVKELTNFIENVVEFNCEEEEDALKMETNAEYDESLNIHRGEDSDDKIEKYRSPVKNILDVSKKFDSSRKQLFPAWTMNSKNVDELLLQTYISNVILKDDPRKSTKLNINNLLDQKESESSGDTHNIGSNTENAQPPTIDVDDLEQLSFPKLKLVDDSCSGNYLKVESGPLSEAFNNLVRGLKDLLQKVDELLEAMDSRPHWNRMVGKSNSPWKQNNPQMDLDSSPPMDRKPKILKQWTETRLKFLKLTASLKSYLQPCTTLAEIVDFLADVKTAIIQCVDFHKVQDSLNLSENIQTAFGVDSDDRYVVNLENRILTIEVTLKNITFEIDRIYEDYIKEK